MKLPVIRPPFEMEANATVYFEVPTGQFRIEKATRNKVSINTEKSITAWLTETGNKFDSQDVAGSNLTSRDVRGYFLIDALPPGLRGSDRIRAVIKNSNGTEEVRLFFNESATPLTGIIIGSLGVPFRGYIQAIGGAG
jgi:hypothetical protein